VHECGLVHKVEGLVRVHTCRAQGHSALHASLSDIF
jgi:hypothetical protein